MLNSNLVSISCRKRIAISVSPKSNGNAENCKPSIEHDRQTASIFWLFFRVAQHRRVFISKLSSVCGLILYFPQPNFISLIRQSSNSGELNVKGLDEDTVFHLTVSHGKNNDPIEALYLTVKSQLTPEKRQEAAKKLVGSLPDTTVRTVVFVAETDDLDFCLSGFLFLPNTTTPTETTIMSPPTSKLFHSRSILETDILKESSVGIIGLGSGGSQVAVEFAKAGVGKLVLVDYDRLELNNISRHACGLSDVGRLKTNALKDLLLNKNPEASIETFELDIDETTHNDYPAMNSLVPDPLAPSCPVPV